MGQAFTSCRVGFWNKFDSRDHSSLRSDSVRWRPWLFSSPLQCRRAMTMSLLAGRLWPHCKNILRQEMCGFLLFPLTCEQILEQILYSLLSVFAKCLLCQLWNNAICQEEIFKVRANSRRSVYVLLRHKEELTVFLAEMNAPEGFTVRAVTEEEHKAQAGSWLMSRLLIKFRGY